MRVLRSAIIAAGAGDPESGCDSKTAHDGALSSCLVGHEVSDELAVIAGSGSCKMTSLWVV